MMFSPIDYTSSGLAGFSARQGASALETLREPSIFGECKLAACSIFRGAASNAGDGEDVY